LRHTDRSFSFLATGGSLAVPAVDKLGWFEMRETNRWRWEALLEHVAPDAGEFERVADEVCRKALNIARSSLHPLLQQNGLDRLDRRTEFLQAFKSALEEGIARKLALWQPGTQAVFKYEETRLPSLEDWDGSIHLLVKVPRLSAALDILANTLDRSLLKSLKRLGWPRVRARQSVLEVQQVTPRELRHGIGYGAMFYAVYMAPARIWPREQPGR
jgi:hypothetical protein